MTEPTMEMILESVAQAILLEYSRAAGAGYGPEAIFDPRTVLKARLLPLLKAGQAMRENPYEITVAFKWDAAKRRKEILEAALAAQPAVQDRGAFTEEQCKQLQELHAESQAALAAPSTHKDECENPDCPCHAKAVPRGEVGDNDIFLLACKLVDTAASDRKTYWLPALSQLCEAVRRQDKEQQP